MIVLRDNIFDYKRGYGFNLYKTSFAKFDDGFSANCYDVPLWNTKYIRTTMKPNTTYTFSVDYEVENYPDAPLNRIHNSEMLLYSISTKKNYGTLCSFKVSKTGDKGRIVNTFTTLNEVFPSDIRLYVYTTHHKGDSGTEYAKINFNKPMLVEGNTERPFIPCYAIVKKLYYGDREVKYIYKGQTKIADMIVAPIDDLMFPNDFEEYSEGVVF